MKQQIHLRTGIACTMRAITFGVITSFLTFCETFSQNTWTPKANVGVGTRYSAVGFSIGNKGYIGTGVQYQTAYYKDFWEWDQTTNIWTQKANYGGGEVWAAVGFSIGNKGYIGTGQNGVTGNCQDFWEYNPALNSWVQKANFPIARGQAVGFSIGNKGYIGTGITSAGAQKDFWEWDQATDTWTKKADVGSGTVYAAVGFSIGNKGYIGTGGLKKDFWEWDQATDTWAKKADFGGKGRFDAVGFSIGSKGYIGTGYDMITLFYDFWEWDQATNLWTQKADVGGGGRSEPVGFSIGNKGYIGTGEVHGYVKYDKDDFWEYSPDGCSISAAISSDPAPNTTFCVGQNVYMAASGGISYVWSTGDTDANIAATLSITTTYSVTVTDANGCTGISFTTFIVDTNCTTTGISQLYSNILQAGIWPNPSAGEFWLSIPSGQITSYKLQITDFEIYNVMGEKVYTSSLTPLSSGKGDGGEVIDLSSQPEGIYFLQVRTGQGTAAQKLIIHK